MTARDINLLKDDVDATFQPLLRINVQFVHLLHQLLQLLQCQLVQDALQFAIQLLQTRQILALHPPFRLGLVSCCDSRLA